MSAILEISDGITTVSLLSNQDGFFLFDWLPSTAEIKDGGFYRDSPIADGKKLVVRRRDNAVETFSLKLSASSQDLAIQQVQELRRLLEKAAHYWTTDWQGEPVWIKARASLETNARYAIVVQGRLLTDDNYYSQPFLQPECAAVMDELELQIERGEWLSNRPGDSSCQEISSTQSWTPSSWLVNDASPVGTVFDVFQTKAGTLLAADTSQLWRSTTGAPGSWAARSFGAGHWNFDPGIIYCFCESPNYVWAQTASGTHRSADDGLTWIRLSAVVSSTPNSLIWHSSGCLVLASMGTGLYYNTDGEGGNVWNLWWADTQVMCCHEIKSTQESANGYVMIGRAGAPSNPPVGCSVSKIPGSGTFMPCGVTTSNVYCFYEATDDTGVDYLYAGSGTLLFRTKVATPIWYAWGVCASGFTAGVYDVTRGANGVYHLTDSARVWQSNDMLAWTSFSAAAAGQFYSVLYSSTGEAIYGGEAGDIWWLSTSALNMGRTTTCLEEVYFRNSYSIAQITDVYIDDNGAYTQLFPGSTLPYSMFPAAPVANQDAIMFCVSGLAVGNGPFSNLVFDIGTPAYDLTIVWQYLDTVGPTWQAIGAIYFLQDNTYIGLAATPQRFGKVGVSSVHWDQGLGNWGKATPGGGLPTGYWVRALITAVGANPVVPTQQNRDIYTANKPNIAVAGTSVPGDIPALLRITARNMADSSYVANVPCGGGGLKYLSAEVNRVLCGLRSTDRGSNFRAFINLSDTQWPLGQSVTVGAETTFQTLVSTPTGRWCYYHPTGAEYMADRVLVTLSTELSLHYYGTFHVYLRCREYHATNSPGNIGVRLKIRMGSGGLEHITDTKYCPTTNDWQLIDFGQVSIPVSSVLTRSNLGDTLKIIVQCSATNNSTDLYLYDLILLPADEWLGEFINTSGIYAGFIDDGKLLDMDSVASPKHVLRGICKRYSGNLITSVYGVSSVGPMILQANADQNLWFFTASNYVATAVDDSGVNNKSYISDASQSFVRWGVKPGQTIVNLTDGSLGVISAVTETRIDAALFEGADNDFDDGDVAYVVTDSWVAEPRCAFRAQAWKNERYLTARGAR